MKENATTVALALIGSITIIAVWLIYSSRNASQQSQANPLKTYQTTSSSYETKERSEENVTISVTPQTLTENAEPSFYIEFETHSVELDFDVSAITTLVDDRENSFGQATWEGSPPGGHHRKGTLSFANNLSKSTKNVTLTFKDISNVPARIFTWKVKQ